VHPRDVKERYAEKTADARARREEEERQKVLPSLSFLKLVSSSLYETSILDGVNGIHFPNLPERTINKNSSNFFFSFSFFSLSTLMLRRNRAEEGGN
jgi:hypothetical protein